MTNKYYLLENVKKSNELIPEFTMYQGGKGQLEQQLFETEPIFDNGDFGLVELKNDSRRNHKYLHLLVEGDPKDFSQFENFVESNNIKLVGAKRTTDDSLDNLVSSYIPEKTSTKLLNSTKHVAKAIDNFVSTDDFTAFSGLIATLSAFGQYVVAVGTASDSAVIYSPSLIAVTAGIGSLSIYSKIKRENYRRFK